MPEQPAELDFYTTMREIAADDPVMLEEIRISELRELRQIPAQVRRHGKVRQFLHTARLQIEMVLAPENFRDQKIDELYNQN